MKRTLLPALAVLVGCDLQFIALDEGMEVGVSIRSTHVAEPSAEVIVSNTSSPDFLRVEVDGEVLTPERADAQIGIGARFVYRDTVAGDSLRPAVTVDLTQTLRDDRTRIDVPFVVRTGDAECLASGDLLLPHRFDGSAFPDSTTSWDIFLYDPRGRPLTHVDGDGEPLPEPLRIASALVPASVAVARVTLFASDRLDWGSHPLEVSVTSDVRWEIGEACATEGP